MQKETINLNLTTHGLGFTISGGIDAPNDKGDKGVFVKEVHPNGAAIESGLMVGDRLLSVNGQTLIDIDHETAVLRIKESIPSQHVTLEVVREDSVSAVIVESAESQKHGNKLALAREAFKSQDPDLSRLAHELGGAQEMHQRAAGQYLKAAVFGGLDGIITTFAVVASVTGANLATGVVIVMGFSNLIADGISMGVGEYLSGVSETQYTISERNREEWEFDSNPEGEIKEMVDLYMEKGFSEEEAEHILRIMAKHRDFFIDHMMVEELGLMSPDEDESPMKNGLVMFLSFLTFGIIPLLSYIALSTVDFGVRRSTVLFGIACGLTAVALFTLGAIKSKFSTQSWYISGSTILFNGGLAAAAAYLVGFGLESLIDLEECDD